MYECVRVLFFLLVPSDIGVDTVEAPMCRHPGRSLSGCSRVLGARARAIAGNTVLGVLIFLLYTYIMSNMYH